MRRLRQALPLLPFVAVVSIFLLIPTGTVIVNAFVSLPAAVLVIARRHRQARPAVWLAYGSLAWLSVLFGAIVIGMLTDLRWYRIIPLGIVERGIVAFEVGAVLALGIWLIRGEFAAAKRIEST